MQVSINKEFEVNVADLAKTMNHEELVYLLNECSIRFDNDSKDRKKLAIAFADGMSETGCRFLAEIVATHYFRN